MCSLPPVAVPVPAKLGCPPHGAGPVRRARRPRPAEALPVIGHSGAQGVHRLLPVGGEAAGAAFEEERGGAGRQRAGLHERPAQALTWCVKFCFL